MTILTYPIFYRKFGIRLSQQLMSPKLWPVNMLDLPMQAIYHYIKYDGIELGPPNDEFLFRNVKKTIFVGHITEISDHLGNPKKITLNINNIVREYTAHNRRMRTLRNLETVIKDKQTLVVYNYCLISKAYKYVRSFYAEYFKWHNSFSAIPKNIAAVVLETDREHFISCEIPKIIPSVSQLNLACKGVSQSLLKIFKDSNSFLLLELWKWLGPDRENSLLSIIPKNKIHLVNLIFTEAGKFVVINLGILNSFREEETIPDEVPNPEAGVVTTPIEEDYVIKSKQTISPVQLQKRLLKFIMKVMEARTVAANVDSVQTTQDDELKEIAKPTIQIVSPTEKDESEINQDLDIPDDESVEEDDDEIKHIGVVYNDNEIKTIQNELDQVEHENTDIQMLDEEETPEEYNLRIKAEDEQLDAELAQLNEIATKQEQDSFDNHATVSEVLEEKEGTLENGIIKICDSLADDGLLTANEYRRFINLSSSYKRIPSPYGEGTLETQAVVKPESLVINHTPHFVDNNTILDKSMLNSSLEEFDSKYITQVLPKHNTSMVLSVQKAGIAVTGYEVESVEDILGAYENHTVKLTPVEGLPSTIKFKIPKIDEDGTFTANHVKYRLRKQRGDKYSYCV